MPERLRLTAPPELANIGSNWALWLVEQCFVAVESELEILVVVSRGFVGLDVFPFD